MSKATKRLFKKKVEDVKKIKRSRYGTKLSNKQIKSQGIENVKRDIARKQRKYDKSVERHNFKKEYLKQNLIDISNIRYKDIEKIKMSDIRNNSVNIENYPFLKNKIGIDFYKKIKLPGDLRMYVAYMDYTGENTLYDLLNLNVNSRPQYLLENLRELVNRPLSAVNGVAGTSSGRAGTAIFLIANNLELMDSYVRVSAVNRHFNRKNSRLSRVRVHSGKNRGYQRIKDVNGNVTHKSVSAFELLLIIVTLMDNVTEQDRGKIYIKFYESLEDICFRDDSDENFLELLKILPKPNYGGVF